MKKVWGRWSGVAIAMQRRTTLERWLPLQRYAFHPLEEPPCSPVLDESYYRIMIYDNLHVFKWFTSPALLRPYYLLWNPVIQTRQSSYFPESPPLIPNLLGC